MLEGRGLLHWWIAPVLDARLEHGHEGFALGAASRAVGLHVLDLLLKLSHGRIEQLLLVRADLVGRLGCGSILGRGAHGDAVRADPGQDSQDGDRYAVVGSGIVVGGHINSSCDFVQVLCRRTSRSCLRGKDQSLLDLLDQQQSAEEVGPSALARQVDLLHQRPSRVDDLVDHVLLEN